MRDSEASATGWTISAFVFTGMSICIFVLFAPQHPVKASCIALGLMITVARHVRANRKRIGAAASALAVANHAAASANHRASLASANHEATLASASRNKGMLALSGVIIAEHAAELTIRRKQLTLTLSYGVVDDSKWLQDVDFFIVERIEGEGVEIRDDPERLQTVREMIDTATSHYPASQLAFSADMDPVEFEQMVADALTDFGWQTRLTKGSGDQGIDVIAEMRDTRVVIQCKRYGSPIGNSEVQEAYAGKAFENADYAAVVSNAEFTRSARQLAETTYVILLHHDELSQLEQQIFGTITIPHSARANGNNTLGAGTVRHRSCIDIVKAHATQLTILRKHLTATSVDGLVDDSQWAQEVTSFIDQFIEPQTGDTTNSLERLKIVQNMIDIATAHYAFARVPLLIDMTPAFYEQSVADTLSNLGWQTRLTDTSEDCYADVLAEMRGKRVMIQCAGFVSPISDASAVQALYHGQLLEGADYSAIVGNAPFTLSAREL